ncbi:endonuclease [Candidatus Neomarinimicrobiota bacterium]
MRRHYLIFLLLISCAYSQVQTTIGEGLAGQDLANYVVINYKPSTTLGYTNARDTMYAIIDLQQGNQLEGVYSGYTITLDLALDPSTDAYNKGINAEHTWPQSKGADVEPQKSDLHHLFPCKDNVNSSRGNDPFGEIPDANTDKWYRLDEVLESIPTANIDEYSEKENTDPDKFEPREIHKGDAARAVFYFYLMYESAANQIFWDVQKDILLQWHYYDPVDKWEYDRTNAIANYQDLPNPFVLDSTLARRIWFYDQPTGLGGDIEAPQQFYLYSNYPNPFNTNTIIRFDLSVQANIRIGIFNIQGIEVARLADSHYAIGGHRIFWDGGTTDGREASTGIYIARLVTPEYNKSIKMVLLK